MAVPITRLNHQMVLMLQKKNRCSGFVLRLTKVSVSNKCRSCNISIPLRDANLKVVSEQAGQRQNVSL